MKMHFSKVVWMMVTEANLAFASLQRNLGIEVKLRPCSGRVLIPSFLVRRMAHGASQPLEAQLLTTYHAHQPQWPNIVHICGVGRA
jgi:hypothetical protein